MKKTLQGKFIFTAMVAVTLLLLVLLGGINLVNWRLVEAQTDQLLRFLTQEESPAASWDGPRRARARAFLPPLGDDDRDRPGFPGVLRQPGPGGLCGHPPDRHGDRGRGRGLRGPVPGAKTRGPSTGSVSAARPPGTAGERSSSFWMSPPTGGTCWRCWPSPPASGPCAGWEPAAGGPLSRRAIAPMAWSFEKQRQFVTNAGHELKTPWPSSGPTPRPWSSTRARPSGAGTSWIRSSG